MVRHITPSDWADMPLIPTRFTVYQISSSLTNTGNSLVDQSVIPFQDAYLLVIVQWFLILVGNTVYVSVSIRTTLEFDDLKFFVAVLVCSPSLSISPCLHCVIISKIEIYHVIILIIPPKFPPDSSN